MTSAPGTPAEPGLFRIFLSYRRADTSGYALSLYENLRRGVGDQPGFAREQIFKDIDTLEPGRDFRQAIREAVESCDILLALIGRQWTSAKDKRGRRLEHPGDFVRLEIEAALRRDIPVIPLLVQDAEMPAEEDLPKSLSDLVYRHAVQLNDSSWPHDVGRLLDSLKRSEEKKAERPTVNVEAGPALLDSAKGRPEAEEAIDRQVEKEKLSPVTAAQRTEDHAPPKVAREPSGRRTDVPQSDLIVTGATFSPDGRLLAVKGKSRGNKRTMVRIVDVESRAQLLDLDTPEPIDDVAFTPDGRFLAAACNVEELFGRGAVLVWDVTSGKELLVLKHPQKVHALTLKVHALTFSPDGAWLATGGGGYGASMETQIWSVPSGKRRMAIKRSNVTELAFGPDGSLLAGGSDNIARLWELERGKRVLGLRHTGTGTYAPLVDGLAFSPDGRLLATTASGIARIWASENGAELLALKPDSLEGVAFSSDGQVLATGGADGDGGAARLWAVDAAVELTLLKHPYDVNSVAFSPTGRLLTTCLKLEWDEHDEVEDAALEARIWDLDSGDDVLVFRHGPE